MFLGISKYLGNGWRIGLGTRLRGSKKPSSKEIREAEFIEFVKKTKAHLEAFTVGYAVANGGDFEQIKKEHDDTSGNISDILKKYPYDPEFTELLDKAYKTINKVLYSGNKGVTARRKITDSIYNVKNYFNQKYPNIEIEYDPTPSKEKTGFPWIKLIIGTILLIVVFRACSSETEQSKVEQNIIPQTKTVKFIEKDKAEILRKLKRIPTKEWEKNLELYKKLLEYEPTNKNYQKKVKFYEGKGKQSTKD